MKLLILLLLTSCGQVLHRGLDSIDKQTRSITEEAVLDKFRYCTDNYYKHPCDDYCYEIYEACLED